MYQRKTVSRPVKNHGITEDTIRGVYERAKEFFSLPLGTKMQASPRSRRKSGSYGGPA
jgi:isopenicillin N synthase-like dioxygenase